MKKATLHFLIILITMCLASCQTIVKHSDPFYNDDGSDDFPNARFPLIKPYYVYNTDLESPWEIELLGINGGLHVTSPKNEGGMYYSYAVVEVNKISVLDG